MNRHSGGQLFALFPIFTLPFLFLIGCERSDLYTTQRQIGDITVQFQIYRQGVPEKEVSDLIERASQRMGELLLKVQAEIDRLNRERGPLQLSDELFGLLRQAESISNATRRVWHPLDGGMIKLWNSSAGSPSMLEIQKQASVIEQSHLQFLDSNRVAIEGQGEIHLKRMLYGWIVDGLAHSLTGGGISDAMISVEGVYRILGSPSSDTPWNFQYALPGYDSTYYRIKPAQGGLSVIDGTQNLWDTTSVVLYNVDGYPETRDNRVVTWAPDASRAGAYCEAMYLMGKHAAFDRVLRIDSVGILYLFPSNYGYMVEADVKWMTSWVELFTDDQ